MLEYLMQTDLMFFLYINVKLANPVTDFIMPYITSGQLIVGTYVICLALLLWKGDKKLRWMVLVSIIVLTLCDQSSSTFLKKWICRPRPCHIMTDINLLVNCGAGYSLPSSHATNVFGQAFLFSLHYKNHAGYLFAYAFLVSISRVFVGVHYPGDILGGLIVGGLIGTVTAIIFAKVYNSFNKTNNNTEL